jgi:hypothetical protein
VQCHSSRVWSRTRTIPSLSLARPRGTCLSSARGISLVLFVFPEPFTDAPTNPASPLFALLLLSSNETCHGSAQKEKPARRAKSVEQIIKQVRAIRKKAERKAARAAAKERKRVERLEAEKAKRADAVLKSRKKAEEAAAKAQAKYEREERIAANRLQAAFDADDRQQAREDRARLKVASGKYAAHSTEEPCKVKILLPSLKVKLPLNGGPLNKQKAVRLKLSGAGITKVQKAPKRTLRTFRVKLCGARTLELYGAIKEPTAAVPAAVPAAVAAIISGPSSIKPPMLSGAFQ